MALSVALWGSSGGRAQAQSATFAGVPQHTAQYSPPAQPLSRVRWSTPIDLKNTGAQAHFGAPLITPANTVLAPVRTTNSGFEVQAFEGATGRHKYTLTSDYILPSASWVPTYQPGIATPSSGTRLYYPGAGGTVYYIEDPDSDTPTAPVQQCFYTTMTNYSTNITGFTNTIFINTPLTADSNGVIYFGFRVQGTAPAPLNTNQSGFARLDPDGNGIYVLAAAAAGGDSLIGRDSHNCAPALSNDGTTLYVAVKHVTSSTYAYLLGLDTTTLATKYSVLLRDPRNGNFAVVTDIATASPMVGPDGDVFFGVLANPSNGSRGFLLHFSGDLTVQKPPSGFGWDYTPAIVPAAMVPSYSGSSAYLLFSKYNNYAGNADGDGINRIALLDPNATQLDPHPSSIGLVEMREIMSVIGCAPDAEYFGPTYPKAVREWCINTAAVNPATKSVFAPSEDGHIYRWNLESNSLAEAFSLGPGLGAPYVPTLIGPDGSVYTLNGGTMFALGGQTNVAVVISSSAPDLRSFVAGDSVTFTATVTNLDGSEPAPTGTVTFQDLTYRALVATNTTLATALPLSNGVASVTTSSLSAGSNYLGNHFITASYSGDDTYPAASATIVQKVHASATITTISSTGPNPGSNAVTFTALVTPVASGFGTPTGMVSFWDGTNFLAQAPLDSSGTVSWTNHNLSAGSHAIRAKYCSDTMFASSSASLIGVAPYLTAALLGDGSVQLTFTNISAAPFTVLGATDVLLPLSNWTELGPAMEILPGQFQFTDPQVTNETSRFYRVRSP